MDATCSSFVEVTVNDRKVFEYIAKFFFYNAKAFAVVKLVHQRKMNICKEASSSSNAFIRKICRDKRLAYHYLPVEEVDDLVVIQCIDIISKCIIIPCNNSHPSILGFLVPVGRDYGT